jgi:hypothetical protein
MFDKIGSYFSASVGRILAFLPNLLSALVIVAVGFILSRVAGTLVRRVLGRLGFDAFVRRQFPIADRAKASPSASKMLGSAVFWLGILVTAAMAADSLGLTALSAGIKRVLAFVPNLLVAVAILAIAAWAAKMIAGLVERVAGRTLARAAQAAVMVMAGFMALDQLGVARNIVTATFVALLGTVAVAAAIAFGVGNIGLARETTQRLVRRGREATESGPPPLDAELPSEPSKH